MEKFYSFINLKKYQLSYLFQVYKVYLKDHGKCVAVKETNGAIFLKPLAEDFESLNVEIEILKQIEHKNIVR